MDGRANHKQTRQIEMLECSRGGTYVCRRRTGHGVFADQRGPGCPAARSKRVALKYCGGCDSGFERVEYFNRVRCAAGDSIKWVTLEEAIFDAILVISGCDTACPERSMDSTYCDRIVSIKDDKSDPLKVVESLLK